MNLLSLSMDPAVQSVTYAAMPTDPASLFVYVLLLVSGYFIWKGSRAG